ncbi:MAG TPA: TorF family putative porin [Solimonas sp.]
MTFKRTVVSVALLGAAAFSGSAFAGVSGNVGVFSDYMFRGITQTSGAAVQGGIDYASDSGFYIGTWGSNLNFAGGTELDVYTGFSGSVGENFSFDIGALYYWYPEEDEVAAPGSPSINTLELYAGFETGPFSLKGYFTNDYFGTDESAYYVLGALALPLAETVSLDIAVGLNAGDGVEATFGEEYIDYKLGVSKSLDGDYTASFALVATDLSDDDPKFVIGLSKSFDF